MKANCGICKKEHGRDALRPYGKDDALICFDCMKADPELEKTAKANFDRRLNKAGPLALLTPDGPKGLLGDGEPS